MSTPPLLPADGDWMLSRVLRGMSLDGFDPEDLPHPYPRLIAAALAAGRSNAIPVTVAALDKLPEELRRPILAALKLLNPRTPRAAPLARSRTAGDLLKANLPPHRWLVDGLLVRPGLTLLGGQPKVGKSWLSLQLARAVALGADVLQRPASQPGAVLYYALEDGPSRLQARLRAAGWDGAENVRFLFGDAIPPLDMGGLTSLAWDIQRRRPALVVIDSLAAAKSSDLAENDSGQVAELMYALARLCSAHDLSMLVVHHHRKLTTGSPLADLRGSGALGGAADSILALYRERNAPESRLGLDSRDTVGGDWTLEFSGCGWRLVGEAALADRSKDERAIARALQAIGPAGATLNEITAVAGLRRDDVLAGLKALVTQGQVVREELLAANGAGRPRKIYRASQFNSVPDLHNVSGI
jgi:AAA domain